MRTHWIVLSIIALGGGGGLISSASSEEYRGTWEQQSACTSDVWRLCSDRIPDVGRIVACLRQNTDSLSNGCRAVFKSDPDVTQSVPRARPVQPRRYDPRYDRRYDRRPYDPRYDDDEE
jgi:hypothetical protein